MLQPVLQRETNGVSRTTYKEGGLVERPAGVFSSCPGCAGHRSSAVPKRFSRSLVDQDARGRRDNAGAPSHANGDGLHARDGSVVAPVGTDDTEKEESGGTDLTDFNYSRICSLGATGTLL